jgi:F-type H+-transporting ATPase subunit delta
MALHAGSVSNHESRRQVAHQRKAVAGVAGRYALALYELALEAQGVDETGVDLERFQALLDSSDDLRRLVKSPVYGAEEQVQALQAIFDSVGIAGLAGKLILLAAKNRRLSAISDIIQAYRSLVAEARGELTAEVTSAEELSGGQVDALKSELARSMGRNVMLVTRTDASLIGGLVLTVGSRMIDDSLRTKLQNLKMTMKGAG